MADKEVAEIVEVAVPDFGLKEVRMLPAAEVRIKAVDLKDLISPGAREAVLAQLKLKGKNPGSTEIKLLLTAMDDDQGNAMEPQIVH